MRATPRHPTDKVIFSIWGLNRSAMEERAAESERRREPREKMLGTALMSWSNGYRSMSCVVLDWTQSGARIKPNDIVGCPDQFTLVTKNGNRVPCEVRWRDKGVLGVRFV